MRYNLNPIAGITRAGRDRAAMVQNTVADAQAAGEFNRNYDEVMIKRSLLSPPGPPTTKREAAESARVMAGMKSDARTIGHMDSAIDKRQSEIDDLRYSRFEEGGPSRREVRKGTRAGKKDVKALTAARDQVVQDINAKNAAEYGN